MSDNEFYVDDETVVSFFVGELGWLLQKWSGYLRYLKRNTYQDRKFIIMMDLHYHEFVKDFVHLTLGLPDWFYELGLERDCYEAPLSGSAPGSLTPPSVYSKLIEELRHYYNKDKAIEVWPPRGCTDWTEKHLQLFKKFTAKRIIPKRDRPLICVFPRGRTRSAQRNVPRYVWWELVDNLKQHFDVVLGGTPTGSFLADYPKDEHVIDMINYDKNDKTDKIVQYLNNAWFSVSSQSGPTHISLFCGTPTYIIGHEKKRHAEDENRFDTPASFRYVTDYRAIDAKTILQDLQDFANALLSARHTSVIPTIARPSLRQLTGKKELVGVEIGVDEGDNAYDMLDKLDIKTLYLVDPYKSYDQFQKQEEHLSIAKEKLKQFEDKIVWVYKKSSDAKDDIPNNLDFVYIDGDHKKEAVIEDVNNYYPKIKHRGLLAGHDFDSQSVQDAISNVLLGRQLAYGNCLDGDAMDWWMHRGTSLRSALSQIKDKKDVVGAEIGVYRGEHSRAILDELDIKKLYLIDPYKPYHDYNENNMNTIKAAAKIELEKDKDKIVWIYEPSETAYNKIEDKLDFVYIDGNHTFEGVTKDLEKYFDLVKDDGILAGHDYDNKEVEKAVNDFFCRKNMVIACANDPDDPQTTEWWVLKGSDPFESIVFKGIENLNELSSSEE